MDVPFVEIEGQTLLNSVHIYVSKGNSMATGFLKLPACKYPSIQPVSIHRSIELSFAEAPTKFAWS